MRSAWFGLMSVVALSGCYVHARSEPAYVETTAAPVEYNTYPATFYEGHNVYWVGNRWGWHDGDHWRYYDHEPVELRRHREAYVHCAPDRHEERREEHREDHRR